MKLPPKQEYLSVQALDMIFAELPTVLKEVVHHAESCVLVAFAHELLPAAQIVRDLLSGIFSARNQTHFSPKFMAPRHSGLTRTPATGARTR
jgi:hypothetical protein